MVVMAYCFYASCYRFYTGPVSDHFDGKRFYNPDGDHIHSTLETLKWRMTSKRSPWPLHIDNKVYPIPPQRVDGTNLTAIFIGHATVLLQTEGLNILTDPIWSERASPFNFAGPKRVRAPGISLVNLPKIDIILISHNHYDQLDLPTLAALYKRDHPLILAGLGVDKQIRNAYPGIDVHPMDWNDHVLLKNKVAIYFVPAQHWSKRTLFDTNKTLWGGFVIKLPGGNIYFTGDSGFGSGEIFKKEITRFAPIRLALLPIGAYEPRWFMKGHHMDPAESVKVFNIIQARYALAIHFGTFQLTDESPEAPLGALKAALLEARIKLSRFRVLGEGESWNVPPANDL
jgi:L-ascorbate metabolism protein UlaG (beta-lactamase superfamily)